MLYRSTFSTSYNFRLLILTGVLSVFRSGLAVRVLASSRFFESNIVVCLPDEAEFSLEVDLF